MPVRANLRMVMVVDVKVLKKNTALSGVFKILVAGNGFEPLTFRL